jgi:hypothetical protein
MRVKISYVVDISDDIRRAINAWYGRPGLASRDDIKRWYEANGHSMDDDLSLDAAQAAEAENG